MIANWYEVSLLLTGCSRSKCALLLASDHPGEPVPSTSDGVPRFF